MTKTIGSCVAVALIVVAAASYSYPASQEILLKKRVCRFTFHGRMFQARTHNQGDWRAGISLAGRALAEHADVPICIEELALRPGVDVAPVEIDAKNATVKAILDQMISQDARYVYRERLGVIELLPRGAEHDPADCLNTVIPAFRGRESWNSLIENLRCEVDIVSRDLKAVISFPGCGGSYPGVAQPPRGLIEADFKNQTVRDILDLLCAKVGNMAWTAICEATPEGHAVEIHTHRPGSRSLVDSVPSNSTVSRPTTCLECHYHQPCRPE